MTISQALVFRQAVKSWLSKKQRQHYPNLIMAEMKYDDVATMRKSNNGLC